MAFFCLRESVLFLCFPRSDVQSRDLCSRGAAAVVVSCAASCLVFSSLSRLTKCGSDLFSFYVWRWVLHQFSGAHRAPRFQSSSTPRCLRAEGTNTSLSGGKHQLRRPHFLIIGCLTSSWLHMIGVCSSPSVEQTKVPPHSRQQPHWAPSPPPAPSRSTGMWTRAGKEENVYLIPVWEEKLSLALSITTQFHLVRGVASLPSWLSFTNSEGIAPDESKITETKDKSKCKNIKCIRSRCKRT